MRNYFSVDQKCVPAMKCAQNLAKICFIFRQVPGSWIRIGVVSRANEGAHVHLQEPSRGPPLNATYLPGYCSILLHPESTTLDQSCTSCDHTVDKEFGQKRGPGLLPHLMQPICLHTEGSQLPPNIDIAAIKTFRS